MSYSSVYIYIINGARVWGYRGDQVLKKSNLSGKILLMIRKVIASNSYNFILSEIIKPLALIREIKIVCLYNWIG